MNKKNKQTDSCHCGCGRTFIMVDNRFNPPVKMAIMPYIVHDRKFINKAHYQKYVVLLKQRNEQCQKP